MTWELTARYELVGFSEAFPMAAAASNTPITAMLT